MDKDNNIYYNIKMSKKKQYDKEIIMYIIFGILTTVVSWGTYAIFIATFPIKDTKLMVFTSNLVSWICSVVFVFVTNKIWVFRSRSWEAKKVITEGVALISSRMLTGIIEVLGVPFLSSCGFDQIFFSMAKKVGIHWNFFYVDGIYSKMAFAVIVVVLNYVFSKLFVFKEGKR